MAGPITTASLTWTHDLQFDATTGQTALTIDSRGKRAHRRSRRWPWRLPGCMAIDVVDIVTKGRHDLQRPDARPSPPTAPRNRRGASSRWRCTSS